MAANYIGYTVAKQTEPNCYREETATAHQLATQILSSVLQCHLSGLLSHIFLLFKLN